MKVKRYNLTNPYDCGMEKHPTGEYVLFEAYKEMCDYTDRLVEHKDMVCLPADLANLRTANAAFAIENHDLKERCDKLNGVILACHRAFIGGSDFVQSEARRLAEEAVNELVYNNVND